MELKEYMEKYIDILNVRKGFAEEDLRWRLQNAKDEKRATAVAQTAIWAVQDEARIGVYEDVIKDITSFLEAIEEGKVKA